MGGVHFRGSLLPGPLLPALAAEAARPQTTSSACKPKQKRRAPRDSADYCTYVFALLLVAPMGLFKIGVFASYLDSRRNDYAVTKPYRNGRIVT